MRWSDGTTNLMHISLSKLWELVINSEPLGAAVDVLQRVAMSEQLNKRRIIHFSKKWRYNFQEDTQRKIEKHYQSTAHIAFVLLLKQVFPYLNVTFLKYVNSVLFCFILISERCIDEIVVHREMSVLTDSLNKIMMYLRS